MKKNCLLISVCSLVSALLILSCHVGLGEAVDIKAPTISITTPVAKAQVRDNFVISGLWNDDMGLNNIKIVLENTVTKQTYPEKSSQEEIAVIANEEPGYNAVFSSDGTWTCSIKVLSETGEKIIPDGSYIAKATATDNATTPHSTSATQVFSIDNTAPVLVITSPSSTDIENPATYGKLFSIQGTYSDDSNIDSIFVTILDENGNEIDGAVKTLKIKGTTIDDTVALWEGADGLYEKIYGTNIDAGTKKFYTKVTIYDSARKVPAEQGDKGNSCSYFLMQNEVEEFFSNTNEQFKTTELYSLLAGTATAGEFDPAYTNLVESINDTFENESGVKKTRAAFSLNPVNNPTFGVSGYSSFIPGVDGKETELDSYASDGVSGLYEFKDKSSLSITVTPGRDGYLLRQNSLELSLIECSVDGNALTNEDGTYKNQIKINKDDITVSMVGTSYSMEVQLRETEYDGLKIGNYYIIKVDGTDTKNNIISNGAQVFAIKYSPANTTPPLIKLTEPSSTALSIKNNAEVIFRGTVEYYQDELKMAAYIGDPSEDGYVVVPADKITIGNNISGGTKIKREFSFELPQSVLEDIEDGSFAVYVYAELVAAQQTGTAYVQITNDRNAPAFAEDYTITPTVEIADSEGKTVSYVNGTISIEASVSDDITLKPEVFYSLDDGANWNSLGAVTKISIKDIDTTKFADNSPKILTLKAVDGVGNESVKKFTLNVNQSTDTPSVTVSNADVSFKKVDSIIKTQENIFGTTSNTNLSGYITDDDGIKTIKVLWQKGSEWLENAETEQKEYDVKGKTSYSLTHRLPEQEGSYVLKIQVQDEKQEKTGFNSCVVEPFVVGVDDGAPKVNVNVENGIYLAADSTYELAGTVDDEKAVVSIYSDSACTQNIGTATVKGKAWKYNLETGSKDRSIYVQAKDGFGLKSMAEFSYKVDTAAPVFAITSVNNESGTALSKDSELISLYGSLDNYFTVKGTLADEEGGSGLEGKMYYKVCSEQDKTEDGFYNLSDGKWLNIAIKNTANGYTWELPVDFASTKYESANTFGSFNNGDSVYIYFATKDNAGNVSLIKENPSAKIKVVIDGIAPEFKEKPEIVAGMTTTISVQAKDSGTGIASANLYLNGTKLENVEPQTGTGTAAGENQEAAGTASEWETYTYSFDAKELSLGQNKITIKATDEAGNVRESDAVVVENNAPAFMDQQTGIPTDSYKKSYGNTSTTIKEYNYVNKVFTTKAKVFVTGTNNSLTSFVYKDTYVTIGADDKEVTATIKEETAIELDADGNFILNFPEAGSAELSEYEGKFVTRTFTATNIYGQSSTWEIRFVFDTTKPVLNVAETTIGTESVSLFAAGNGVWFKNDSLVTEGTYTENGSGLSLIKYTLTDASGNKVKEDGIIYPVGTKFTSLLSGFTEGPQGNTLTIQAVDHAGNESEVTTYNPIIVDTTKPIAQKITANETSDESSYIWYMYDGAAEWSKCENSPVVTNKQKTIYLCGGYTDSSEVANAKYSGIQSLKLSVLNEEIEATLKPKAGTAEGIWECSLSPETLERLFPDSDSYTVTLKIKDKVGNADNSTTFTFKVDDKPPVFAAEYAITPSVDIQQGESTVSYVNGTVTIETSVSDNITLQPIVEYSLDDGATWIKHGKATKVSIKGIDTTKFTDNTEKVIKLRATDEVGFTATKDIPLNVNQSTDTPAADISNAFTNITKLEDIVNEQKNIFGTLSNRNIIGTISDDDGIDTVTVYWQDGATETWSDAANVTQSKVYTVGGKSSYTLSHELQAVEGSYLIKIEIKDSKQETTGYNKKLIGPFLVGVDKGAPKLTVGATDNIYLAKDHNFTLSGNVDDAGASVKIYSDISCADNKFVATAKEAGSNSATWSYEFTVGENGDTLYIQAKDNFGQTSIESFTYRVDTKAPTFTISGVNGKDAAVGAGTDVPVYSDYGNLRNYFTVKGTLEDEENGSGLCGSMFYKLSKTLNTTEEGVYDIDGTWHSVSIKQSTAGATWEAPVPLNDFADGDTVYIHFATKDNAGNVSLIKENPSAKIKVVIDGIAPKFKDVPEFTCGANKDEVSKVKVLIKDSETAVEKTELYLNGTLYTDAAFVKADGTDTEEGWTVYTYSLASEKLTAGQNKITIKAQDKAGNAEDSGTVIINNVEPAFATQNSGISEDNYKTAYGAAATRKDYYYVNDVFTMEGSLVLSGENNKLSSLVYSDSYITLGAGASVEEKQIIKEETALELDADGKFTLNYPAAGSAELSNYEGKFITRTFTATNVYGQSSTWETRFVFDTTKPVLLKDQTKIGGTDSDKVEKSDDSQINDVWFNSDSLQVEGKYTEEGSGIARISYTISNADSNVKVVEGTIYTADKGNYETFSNLINGFINGTDGNILTLVAADKAGNESASCKFRINVDTTAADLKLAKYKLEGMNFAETGEEIFVNGKKILTVYGSYKDEQSGVGALKFALKADGQDNSTVLTPTSIKYSKAENLETLGFENEAAGWEDYPESVTAADKKAFRYWKAEFNSTDSLTKELIVNEKTLEVIGVNTAKSPSSQKILISLDESLPQIQDPKLGEKPLTDMSEKYLSSYSKTESGSEVYFVNNEKKMFTLSGLASDNVKLESVKLSVKTGTGEDATELIAEGVYNNAGTTGQWSFAGIKLPESLVETAKSVAAKITAQDIAGNIGESYVTIKFDTVAPKSKYEADEKGKDKYFRIGSADNDKLKKDDGTFDEDKLETGEKWNNSLDSDVGGKYSPGTFGNDSTIEIRGLFEESEEGSGIKTIYYYISGTEIAPAFVNDLVSGNASAQGSFAPSSAPEKRRVTYNVEDGKDENNETKYKKESQEITSNFRTALAGFNSSTNYLVLIAEDNAGNRDSSIVYHINKDVTVPEITSNTENVLFTNGKSSITLNGTAEDKSAEENGTASGIRNITVYIDDTIDEKTIKIEKEAVYNKTTKEWSVTIPATTFEGVGSGSISVYAKATDNAGTGNVKTISAASITIDQKAPEVIITVPNDADLLADGIQVNKTISLSGTASDKNGLKEESGTEKTMNLYYTTKAELGNLASAPETITTGENAAESWVQFSSAAHDTGWTSSSFNTAKLDGTNAIADKTDVYIIASATDRAGNTGYSKPIQVQVDQNSDRPVLKISNLDKPVDGEDSYLINSKKIMGSVSDDDGVASISIKIVNKAGTTAPTSTEWAAASNVTLSSGSFSYNLGDEDGEKDLWFRITDSKGASFVSGSKDSEQEDDTVNQPKLYFADMEETETALSASSAISFVMDNNAPVLGDLNFAAAAGTTALASAEANQAVSTTTVVGGVTKKYVKFAVTADDSGSGIESVKGTIKVGSETKEYTFAKATIPADPENQDSSSQVIFITDAIDVGKANTIGYTNASYTITFTATDKAGLSTQKTKNFTVDNLAPDASLISPAASDEVTGAITLIGTTLDASSDVSETKYVIGKDVEYEEDGVTKKRELTAEEALALAQDEGTVCNLLTGTSATGWKFVLDGTAGGNAKLPANATDLLDYSTITHTEADIYTLPVYIYTKDALGNEGITQTTITFNPFGDRPKAALTYPLGNYRTEGQTDEQAKLYTTNYSNVSGSIRITGSAEDNESVSSGKVYIQLDVNNDGEFDSADLTILEGLKVAGTDSPIYTIRKKASEIPGKTDVSSLGAAGDDFWGILVNGTNSWNFTINTENELQMNYTSLGTDSGKYKVGIRAIAMDNKGVLGNWSDSQYFMIDLNAPSIEESSIRTNIADEKEVPASYESDMFLSGTKTLQLKISDKSGLKSVKYTYSDSLETINLSTLSGTAELGTPVESAEKKTYTINIPLSKLAEELGTDTVALKVVATKDSDTETTTYERYLVHFDNTAPQIDNLTLNSVAYENSDKKIVNSNGYFTIGGQASDDGAGFERMSFYFMREPGTTITESRIYDVMIAPDANETDSKKQPNYISTSGLATKTVKIGTGENAESFTIYGKSQELTVSAEKSGQTKLTGYKTDAHVRAGGYVQIGSTWHKIKKIDGENIILVTPTTALGKQTVFFAYMQSIDNTGTEKSDGLGGVSSGDDDDKMPESIIKSQTTWNYDASFFSNYIPDGPGKLVTFVYDKAGNVSAKTYNVSVQNKAPRLTKLWLSTDLNASGTFADDAESGLTEIIEYNVLGKVGEQTNYKNMKTVDYKGERFIIKNKFAVIPEFTNGNGDIYMALNNAAESDSTPTALSSTEYTTQAAAVAALYSSQGATAVPDIESFTLARTGDSKLAYVIDNADVGAASYDSSDGSEKDRAMSFTFWDSTEDTISGVNSNWCYLRISDLVVNVTDQKAPNTVVEPFFWNSHDDNSLYQNSYQNGHIELVEEGSTDDPQVSGKISIRGWAFDDHTLGSIWVKFDGFTPFARAEAVPAVGNTPAQDAIPAVYDGEADTDGYYKVAAYVEKEDGSGKEWKSYAITENVAGNKWAFSVTPDYLGQAGHKVRWQLDIDTSAIEGAMGNDKKVYVRAIDETGSAASATAATVTAHTSSPTENGTSASSDSEYNKPSYQMDVVPYISGISTDAAGNNPATRSRLGRYPVRAGDTIYIKGFNFGTGTISVTRRKTAADGTMAGAGAGAETIADANRVDANTISITAPAKSGFIHLMIGGIEASNNKNNNAKGYNIEAGFKATGTTTYGRTEANTAGSNFWTDDRYLSVWNNTALTNSTTPWDGTVRKIKTSDLKKGKFYTNTSGSAVNEQNNSLDTWYSAWSSPNMMFYNSMGNGNCDGIRTLYNNSQAAFVVPVETADMAIIGGIPWFVFDDNYVGGSSANSWGAGLMVARQGYSFPKNSLNSTNTINTAENLNIVERQGNSTAADSRDSSGGYDSVLYQFKNPRITGWYDETPVNINNGIATVKYDGTVYIYVSYYDSFAHCLKYAAFKEGWSIEGVGEKWGNINGTKNFSSLARAADNMAKPSTVVAGVDRLYTASDFSENNGVDAGEWSDIMIDPSDHRPVIIYYNKTAGTLEVAHGKSDAPSTANYKASAGEFEDTTATGWTKTTSITPVAGHDFGRYVSAEIDADGNIHATAQDFTTGALYYIFLEKSGNSYTATYTLVDAECSSAVCTDITLDENSNPYISYIEQAKKNPKIAFKNNDGYFDAESDPIVYEAKEMKTSVMSNVYESTTTSNKAKAAIGFNSDMYAVDFLRDE